MKEKKEFTETDDWIIWNNIFKAWLVKTWHQLSADVIVANNTTDVVDVDVVCVRCDKTREKTRGEEKGDPKGAERSREETREAEQRKWLCGCSQRERCPRAEHTTFFSNVMEISLANELWLWAVKCCQMSRFFFFFFFFFSPFRLIKTWSGQGFFCLCFFVRVWPRFFGGQRPWEPEPPVDTRGRWFVFPLWCDTYTSRYAAISCSLFGLPAQRLPVLQQFSPAKKKKTKGKSKWNLVEAVVVPQIKWKALVVINASYEGEDDGGLWSEPL